MIRVKEHTILIDIDFDKENSAMEFAFIQDFLYERYSARRKTTHSFEFDFEYASLDEIQRLIENIEIYLQKDKDLVVMYYFLPTGINGRYKFYQTTVGRPYGENPNTNPLGL